MTSTKTKIMGEGGIHLHRLHTKEKTALDGIHKHIFFVNDRLLMTELDGSHSHSVDIEKNLTSIEENPIHEHKVLIKTERGPVELRTQSSSPHAHEIQSEASTLSGLHTHLLKAGDQSFLSILPGTLIDEVERASKQAKGLSNLNLRKSLTPPLELDFGTIKRLNQPEISEVLKIAVTSCLLKSLSRLSDGLRIQALILSKERFTDVGAAQRFVMDHSLQSRTIEDRDGAFTFLILSSDRFQEPTLQRIRITEGVEAVVGFLTEEERLTEAPQVTNESESTSSSTSNSVAQDITHSLDLSECAKKLEGIKALFSCGITEQKKVVEKCFDYPILKQVEDKRLVMGPLLIPETVDLQNEIVSREEIENAAHNYMTKLTFQKDPEFLSKIGLNSRADQGFMHVDFSKKIAVVESYIAPVSFELNKRQVVEGTWMVTVKVFDDEVWNLIKAGKIRGFSIGGEARLIDEKGVHKSMQITPDFNRISWEAA